VWLKLAGVWVPRDRQKGHQQGKNLKKERGQVQLRKKTCDNLYSRELNMESNLGAKVGSFRYVSSFRKKGWRPEHCQNFSKTDDDTRAKK